MVQKLQIIWAFLLVILLPRTFKNGPSGHTALNKPRWITASFSIRKDDDLQIFEATFSTYFEKFSAAKQVTKLDESSDREYRWVGGATTAPEC